MAASRMFKLNNITTSKMTFYDWCFSIRVIPYVLQSIWTHLLCHFYLLMAFCNHIRLIVKCHICHNAPSQNITIFFKKIENMHKNLKTKFKIYITTLKVKSSLEATTNFLLCTLPFTSSMQNPSYKMHAKLNTPQCIPRLKMGILKRRIKKLKKYYQT